MGSMSRRATARASRDMAGRMKARISTRPRSHDKSPRTSATPLSIGVTPLSKLSRDGGSAAVKGLLATSSPRQASPSAIPSRDPQASPTISGTHWMPTRTRIPAVPAMLAKSACLSRICTEERRRKRVAMQAHPNLRNKERNLHPRQRQVQRPSTDLATRRSREIERHSIAFQLWNRGELPILIPIRNQDGKAVENYCRW